MLLSTIILLGALQGLILSVALFFRRRNHFPNRIFSLLIFVLVFDLLSIWFQISGFAEKHPHFLYLNESLPYLYAPIIFFYIESITGKIKRFKWIHLLNLFPFLIDLFRTSISFYFTSADDKLAGFYMERSSGTPLHSVLITMILFALAIAYHVLLYRRMYEYARDLKNYFSSDSKRRFGWLLMVLAVSTVIWLAVIGMTFAYFASVLPDPIANHIRTIIGILYTLTIYLSAYRILSLPEIFQVNSEMTSALSPINTEIPPKGRKEFDKFKEYVESSRAYLNPEITIGDICSTIDVPVYLISKELNTTLRKNFYFFINEYRVEEAKRMLADEKNAHKSVLTIGFDAGFNSKSTFNDIFKKITGETPSEFRARIAEPPQSE